MSDEIKICASCWEEDCVCDYEQYVTLDRGISDIIIALNLKGYMTTYSCEGHIMDDDGSGRSEIMSIYLTCPNHRFDSLPQGFSYPKGQKHKSFYRTILYKYIKGQLCARIDGKYVPYELEIDRKKHLAILKQWVEELPAMDRSKTGCYSGYLQTGKPKQQEYAYEVKGWKTYRIEIDKAEFENVQQYIFDYQGKIEEITDYDNKLIVFYLAPNDMFSDDRSEYSWWLNNQK